MSNQTLIRSWRDQDFAETLNQDEKSQLLPNPAGEMLLKIIQLHELGGNSTSLAQPTHCSTSMADCCSTSMANTCSTSFADCCN